MKRKIKVKTEDLSQEIYSFRVKQVRWDNLKKDDIVFKMGGQLLIRWNRRVTSPFFEGPYRILSPDKKILQTIEGRYIRILSDDVLYKCIKIPFKEDQE